MIPQLIVEIAFLKVDSLEQAASTLQNEILNVLQQAGLRVTEEAKVSSPSGTHFSLFLEPDGQLTIRIWAKLNRVSVDLLIPDLEKLLTIRENLEANFSKNFGSDSFNTIVLPRGIDLIALNDNNESLMIYKNPKILHKEKTSYQKLAVVDTDIYLRRVLTLDEKIQIANSHLDNYTPGLSDPVLDAAAASGKPAKILVIGGGDGRIMRYLLKKGTANNVIATVDIVEIDKRVIDICERFFDDSMSWQTDPHVNVFIEDAVKWVAQENNSDYDGVIVDCTDVDSAPSLQLFSVPFYQQLAKKLKPGAVFTQQCDVVESYAHQIKSKLEEAGWNKVSVAKIFTPEYMGDTYVCKAQK